MIAQGLLYFIRTAYLYVPSLGSACSSTGLCIKHDATEGDIKIMSVLGRNQFAGPVLVLLHVSETQLPLEKSLNDAMRQEQISGHPFNPVNVQVSMSLQLLALLIGNAGICHRKLLTSISYGSP